MPLVLPRASAAVVSFSNPQEIIISHLDDSIKIGDGVDFLAINSDGSINVGSSGLPSGAATASKQDSGNASLSSIDTKLTSQASSAKQDTGNTSLNSIDTKLSSQATAAKQDVGNASLASIDAALAARSSTANQLIEIARLDTLVSQTDAVEATLLNIQHDYTALATYSASADFSTANLATDFATLTGSASKRVKVTRVGISGVQTIASIVTILIKKRSSANSGGTATIPTPIPLDSTSAAATAVARFYTANPAAVGTDLGNLQIIKLPILDITVSKVATPALTVVNFGTGGSVYPILNNASEVLALSLNGVTVTGDTFSIFWEWTEEV